MRILEKVRKKMKGEKEERMKVNWCSGDKDTVTWVV